MCTLNENSIFWLTLIACIVNSRKKNHQLLNKYIVCLLSFIALLFQNWSGWNQNKSPKPINQMQMSFDCKTLSQWIRVPWNDVNVYNQYHNKHNSPALFTKIPFKAMNKRYSRANFDPTMAKTNNFKSEIIFKVRSNFQSQKNGHNSFHFSSFICLFALLHSGILFRHYYIVPMSDGQYRRIWSFLFCGNTKPNWKLICVTVRLRKNLHDVFFCFLMQ